jgi:hypothetical protein
VTPRQRRDGLTLAVPSLFLFGAIGLINLAGAHFFLSTIRESRSIVKLIIAQMIPFSPQ